MSTHLEKSEEYYFCCRIFVAALLREVARRSRDGGSFNLMRLYSLSQLRYRGAHEVSSTLTKCAFILTNRSVR